MDPGQDPASLITSVVTILGAAGGLGGIAAVLKAWFSRNKGKIVKFGEDGDVVQADGLSVADIIRLIETLERKKQPDVVEAEIIEDEPGRADGFEMPPGT